MCTWHTHTRYVYDYMNFLSLLLCRFALTHYLDCENILMSHVWMAWHVEIGLASWYAYAVYAATVNINEKFFFFNWHSRQINGRQSVDMFWSLSISKIEHYSDSIKHQKVWTFDMEKFKRKQYRRTQTTFKIRKTLSNTPQCIVFFSLFAAFAVGVVW